MSWELYAFLCCQFLVALFIALHDWVPLGALSNRAALRATDTRARLLWVTLVSALPYAIGFVATAHYAATGFPMWLGYLLWISYTAGLYGMLRAWWVPYLLVADPVRAARYQVRFANTHAFLPTRNGIRPDTLHICFHAVFIAAFILLCVLTFSAHAFLMGTRQGLGVAVVLLRPAGCRPALHEFCVLSEPRQSRGQRELIRRVPAGQHVQVMVSSRQFCAEHIGRQDCLEALELTGPVCQGLPLDRRGRGLTGCRIAIRIEEPKGRFVSVSG